VAERVYAVAGSVSKTLAPGTAAPVVSVTVPVTSELACANAPTHTDRTNNGNSKYQCFATLAI